MTVKRIHVGSAVQGLKEALQIDPLTAAIIEDQKIGALLSVLIRGSDVLYCTGYPWYQYSPSARLNCLHFLCRSWYFDCSDLGLEQKNHIRCDRYEDCVRQKEA